MALSIKSEEADQLARELAKQTGESITEAIIKALRERLLRERGRKNPARLGEALRQIRQRCAELPVLDARSADEILGYDEHGLP